MFSTVLLKEREICLLFFGSALYIKECLSSQPWAKWFSLLKHIEWMLLINGILLIFFPRNKPTQSVIDKHGALGKKTLLKGNNVVPLLFNLHLLAVMPIQ